MLFKLSHDTQLAKSVRFLFFGLFAFGGGFFPFLSLVFLPLFLTASICFFSKANFEAE